MRAVVIDSRGEEHLFEGAAFYALSLAVASLDARLRPHVYRPEAPELYAALAPIEGVVQLRRAFELRSAGPVLHDPMVTTT